MIARLMRDDGYSVLILVDETSLDLDLAKNAFLDAQRSNPALLNDSFFEIRSSALVNLVGKIWALNPISVSEDFLSYDEWTEIELTEEDVDKFLPEHAFRGRAVIIADMFDVYYRVTHKHGEKGLGVFEVNLDLT